MNIIAFGWQDNIVEDANKENIIAALEHIKKNIKQHIYWHECVYIDQKTGEKLDKFGCKPYWRFCKALHDGKGTWWPDNGEKIDENTMIFGELNYVAFFYHQAKQKPRIDLKACFEVGRPQHYMDVALNYNTEFEPCVNQTIQNNKDLFALYKEMVCERFKIDPIDIMEIEDD